VSAKTALKLWSDFKGQFGKFSDNLRENRTLVKDKAKVATIEDTQIRFQRLETKA